LALVLAGLPFELNAGIGLGGLVFTNVEMLVLATLALWGLLLLVERRLPRCQAVCALAALAFLAILLSSAALAPAWRGAALKFTARQAQGILLALCLADQLTIRGWPLARRLGLALIVGAAISATLGLLEVAESEQVLALLGAFKDQPTMAGGLLRLSATFVYANVAAMYYEAALPILLIAAGLAARWPIRLLLCTATLALYSATLLTYSRAALVTASAIALLMLLMAFVFGWRRFAQAAAEQRLSRRAARRLGQICALLLALTLGIVLFSQAFRVRMTAPDLADWYRAEYSAAPLPRLAPNALVTLPITVRNRGLLTWRSVGLRPVMLSYHWLDPQTRRVVRYNGRRTILPQPVGVGDALLLYADVQAPEKPGDYILAWDMVVEHSSWFSERGNPMAEFPVAVAGPSAAGLPAPAPEPASMPQQISVHPEPPARSLLWAAALRLWRAHPLLGIGPDVFRHVYGLELGLSSWDDRIHTNSLYLELLVGVGSVGLAAFLLLIVLALSSAARVLLSLRARGITPDGWLALGCAMGVIAFLIHGALDMFLEYSATYLLLWALIGALCRRAASGTKHDSSSAYVQ
jgi:O-Antigen ligase